MEGYTPDAPGTKPEKTTDKDKKVSKESVGSLLNKSFEKSNKEQAAGQLKDLPIWERLIPKPDRKTEASVEAKPVEKDEHARVEFSSAENKEEVVDPSVENLSASERAEVAQAHAREKLNKLSNESKSDDSVEAAADEASREFYEKLAEEPQSFPEILAAIPDEPAESEGEDELGVPASEAARIEQVTEEAPEVAVEPDAETDPEVLALLSSPEAPTELRNDMEFDFAAERAVADNSEDDDEEDAASVQPIVPTAGGGATPPKQPGSPNQSSANQPPQAPNGPGGPGAPGGPAGPGVPGGPGNPNFSPFGAGNPNAAPVIANPNVAPTTIENHYYEDNLGSALLAGGILGYMLGRRRGRIKTERKLRAVSRRLERQIKQTQERIDRQEQAIRSQAREQYRQTERLQAAERPGAQTTAARAEQTPSGVVGATLRPEEVMKRPVPEQIRSMQQSELLVMAERIDVGGASLRQIYESRQITEPGLRRIAGEYLRGGDIKAAVQQERQIKEMQFERDPQMRDRLAGHYAEVDAAQPLTAQQGLASLLGDTAAQPTHHSPATTAATDESEADEKDPKKSGQQILVSAWIALVFVLVIIVVVLALR